MPIWTFVRHGQSVANREGWLAGHHDAPLTEHGRAEATAAQRHVVEPRPQRAFCSDLSRAHQTATLMLEGSGIPLTVTSRLRERSCGDLERRSIAEVKEDPDYRNRLGSWSARPPNGESLLDTALRAVDWLASVDDSTPHTLVVAHGALIGAVLAGLEQTPRTDMRWRPENCEAIRREVPTGAWGRVLDQLRQEAARVGSRN